MVSDNVFFQKFVQYGTNGAIDKRRTMQALSDGIDAWLRDQESLKPTILAELGEYKRLGEGTLINYTLHHLHLPVTKENVEKVRSGLTELEIAGRIAYQKNEAGSRKGRNAGWMIAGTVK